MCYVMRLKNPKGIGVDIQGTNIYWDKLPVRNWAKYAEDTKQAYK